jgi:hypothetical protein
VTTINVRDVGARGDGANDDGAALLRAIDAARARGTGAAVHFPAGRYRIASPRTLPLSPPPLPRDPEAASSAFERSVVAHLPVCGLRHVDLVGEPGATLVMGDPTATGLHLAQCADVAVRTLAIDYDPLPFTQGTVTAVAPASDTFDWRRDAAYPAPTGTPFRTATVRTGLVYTGAGLLDGDAGDKALGDVQVRGRGIYRFHIAASQSPARMAGIAPGSRVVFPARRDGHAIMLTECARCTLDGCAIHSSPQMAVALNACDAISVTACTVAPPSESGRLLSTNADGIHCKNNRADPHIRACHFTGMGDDGINISQDAITLYAAPQPTEWVVSMTPAMRVGDRLGLLRPASGAIRGTAVVCDLRLTVWRGRPAMRAVVDRPVGETVPLAGLGEEAIAAEASSVQAMMRVPGPYPDLLVDFDALGAGFVVRDSIFQRHRARGMVIRSTDGLIAGNRFEDLNDAGILLGMALLWPEVHHARRVRILGNVFTNLSRAANIVVEDRLPANGRSHGRGNEDLAIMGNRFAGYGVGGAITARNATRVAICGNTFIPPEGEAPPALTLDECDHVTWGDNRFSAEAEVGLTDRAAL